jgi:hypothetical protein
VFDTELLGRALESVAEDLFLVSAPAREGLLALTLRWSAIEAPQRADLSSGHPSSFCTVGRRGIRETD